MEDNQASSPIILIIEDDIGMQEMHKWSFSDAIPSAQILQAYDRDSAFSLLNEYSPNVIILDLGLPPDEANATEGIHILQAVRENSARFFHTQVLVYSGSTRIEHALEATKYGAHFVSKGAENESLISFVKALLQTSTLRIQLSKKESEKNNNSSLIGNSKVLHRHFH